MKKFDKGFMILDSEALMFKLKRTLILHNSNKEFYHEPLPYEKQIVSATLDKETNEISICINLDKLKKLL